MYATNGQKDGTAVVAEYWSGDTFSVYDTVTNLSSGKGVICLTDSAKTIVPTAKTGAEVCSTASDGNTSTAGTKAGWAGITKARGMTKDGVAVLGPTAGP